MTLSFRWGEYGDVNPIRCVDSAGDTIDISGFDVTKTKIYILTESKTKVLDTIDDADFTITSPNVIWTITKTQSENQVPGNYRGEVHLQDTGGNRNTVCEFDLFVQKAKGNIT